MKTINWVELHTCIVTPSEMQSEGKMVFAAFQSRWQFYSSGEEILTKAHDHKRLSPVF